MRLQFGVIKDYQIERFTTFLDPNPDPLSEGYNLTQAKLAIAREDCGEPVCTGR